MIKNAYLQLVWCKKEGISAEEKKYEQFHEVRIRKIVKLINLGVSFNVNWYRCHFGCIKQVVVNSEWASSLCEMHSIRRSTHYTA